MGQEKHSCGVSNLRPCLYDWGLVDNRVSFASSTGLGFSVGCGFGGSKVSSTQSNFVFRSNSLTVAFIGHLAYIWIMNLPDISFLVFIIICNIVKPTRVSCVIP